jgi:hypothetical protein
MKNKSIGKAIKTKKGYKFIKDFYQQGIIYKYMGDLDMIDDDYPIYSAEYQDNEYETKATLKELCKDSNLNWLFLFDMLDWQHADGLFYELEDCDWFYGGINK